MGVCWNDIVLVRVGDFQPEQYDAYYEHRTVGFVCLRWDSFKVKCPSVGGELVYWVEVGKEFDHGYHMMQAKYAIAAWCDKNGIEPDLGDIDD